MKSKILIVLCVVLIGLGNVNLCHAEVDNSVAAIADVVLVRPGCFAATVLGSAVFVLAWPFAAMSHSVRHTADTLVIAPAHATFFRPVGDFSDFE